MRPLASALRRTHFLPALVLALTVAAASTAAHAKAAPDSFAALADKLLPSVVNISTTQVVEGRGGLELPKLPPGSPFEDFFKEFFDRNQPDQPQRSRRATSLGSGFVVDAKGFIVTNNHVIQDADEITVVLHDNTRLQAELVGRDTKTDLAVLKVKPNEKEKLTAIEFGDSDSARVGDWIVAIGNPFGLGGTVTAGIISARNRDINSGPYDDFIQTDASINRGNSGGPMFNMNGRLIGINTAIFSPTGGSVGIGFAIPASTAKPVIQQLIKHGQVRRGWLGVHIQAVTDDIAETLGLEEATGALVASVIAGGPAEKAKIEAGDVILRFDNKDVTEMRRLPRIVADTEVGKEVTVEFWRDNKKMTAKAKIEELEEEAAQVAARTKGEPKGGERTVESLGLKLSNITKTAREKFNLDEKARGVVVTSVDPNGPAAEKGIRPGDLIVEVGKNEVSNATEVVNKVLEAKKTGRKKILLLLEGQNGLRFVVVHFGAG